ncbi:MAG: methyl-accepting chemotaxis protein [Lachnospiraceae bacterium]|nr:methyl-accepting chemotaxis protein [Lachnospiraceae bacterium]
MKKAMNQSMLILILNGGAILSVVFLMLSLSMYSKMNRQLDAANEARYELTYNANRFMNGSAYLTNEVRAFAATGIQEHYDNYWNEINNLKNREQGVAAMQEIGITAEEQKMIDEMAALSNSLVPLEEQSMENVQAGDMQAAIDYVYGQEYSSSIEEINTIKENFLETLNARTLGEVTALSEEVSRLKSMMVAALVIVVVLQLINLIFVRLRILSPVIAVRDQMGEIAEGNLSAEFCLQPNTSEIGMLVESICSTKRELKNYIKDINDILAQMAQGNMDLSVNNEYKGEFIPIRDAMIQILDALNNALYQINLTAEQVSSEAKRMAGDAQILSSGAVKQASAVEELSSSIKEIAEEVEHTSKDADNAQSFSLDAMKQLQISNQKMEELTVAIEDISKASNQIGGIIKTIEDIASQTNILALNAAVEAARAGEAGKGFAVVADEVQNLATKSSVSAKSITELIENSLRLVKHGTSLSEDTTRALEGVVSGAKKVTEMVDRIAESATQQSQSLQQVTLGMNQISEVVQMNASTAEKSASSANELYGQAEELKNSVHKFKLRRYR